MGASAARVLWMLVVLATLATPASVSRAWGQAPASAPDPKTAGAPAPAAPPPAPLSIPVPEVARRAEDVSKELRDLESLLLPGPAIEAIEKRVPEITAHIAGQTEATRRLLDGPPTAPTLDGLMAQWVALRSELVGYVTVLTGRATAIENALAQLTTQEKTWTQARNDARASRAPTQVIERIDGVLGAVGASRTRLQAQRAAILVLQDRVAQEVARSESVLESVAAARHDVSGRLLARDGVALWDTAQLAAAVAELPDRIRDAVTDDVAQLGQFVRAHRPRILLRLALFLGFALLMVAARRSAPGWAEPGETTAARVRVFGRPVSAALVLAILVAGWMSLQSPARTPLLLGQVAVLFAAARIARLSLAPALVPTLYVLAGFCLADLVRRAAAVIPVLEQQIFLLEMLAGAIALTWWFASRRRQEAAQAITGRERALRLAAGALLVACAAAFVVGATGYTHLALLIGAGALGNGYLALVLYAGILVGEALVAFALRVRPLSALGMVRRHRPLLERHARRALRVLAVAGWVVFALRYFGLWTSAVELSAAALGAHLERGALSISLGDVLVFAITAGAAFLLSRLLRFALEEDVYPRLQLGRGLTQAISGLLHYGLVLVGFLLALAALGVDLTKVTILAGAFGVGIGFGLQTIVNNFVSGLILLVERRIDVGDAVQIGEVTGQVQQLGMRACTVRTWEGAEVIVPNASLIADKVTNWTLSDRRRRIDVGVGVAYGTPPEKMLDIMLAVARAHPHVLTEPTPAALFLGFGESALRFEMRVWTDRFDLWVQTQSELAVALYAALGEAGFEIPFPQREVRVRGA